MKHFGWMLLAGVAVAASAAGNPVSAAPSRTFQAADFAIAYPKDFAVTKGGVTGPDWRWDGQAPGQTLLRIDVPDSLQPRSNFGGATLTVGRSSDPAARAACLAGKPTGSIRINGVRFAVFSASDAGMSHYHDITSYRALHGGACYAVETTVSHTELDVYDPSMGVKAFDQTGIAAILARMVGSFRFR